MSPMDVRAPGGGDRVEKGLSFWMRCSCDIPNEIKMHVQGSGERSKLEMISASSAMPLRLSKTMQEMLLQHDWESRKNEQNAGRVKHLALSGGEAFRAQDPICCEVETYGLLFLRPFPFMVLVSLNFVESRPCCFLQGHPRALRDWRGESLSRYSVVLWPLTLNKKFLLLGHV